MVNFIIIHNMNKTKHQNQIVDIILRIKIQNGKKKMKKTQFLHLYK